MDGDGSREARLLRKADDALPGMKAFKVYDTVKRTGRIFQVGSQGCSAAGGTNAQN